jgi:tRNA pseudouridine65 synthase
MRRRPFAPPEALPDLPILHRDDRLLAIAKPAGMVVHRGFDNDPITVADVVRDRIVGAPVHAVHRLDRGTSGVVLFALDPEAARLMQMAFEADRIGKRYLALVRGPMTAACTVDNPVPRVKDGPRVPAVTDVEPLAHVGRWSLVEARPRTGRLHQIRRHLKHISHPIVGDVRYGKGDINRMFRETYGLHRLALHAWGLSVPHPDGSDLHVQAPLPDDLAAPWTLVGVWPQVWDATTRRWLATPDA